MGTVLDPFFPSIRDPEFLEVVQQAADMAREQQWVDFATARANAAKAFAADEAIASITCLVRTQASETMLLEFFPNQSTPNLLWNFS